MQEIILENNNLFVAERWDKIRSVLESKGRVTVEELADMFGVSRSTVRRDLLEMNEQGLLVRTRGGAVTSRLVAFDRPLSESGTLNVQLKEKIGRTAAKLISAGETVMLDAGSTAYHVAKNLDVSNVTLVTNSFDAAMVVMAKDDIETIMVGGMVRKHGGSTVGPTAEEQILLFKADTAIVGINGLTVEEGLTTPNLLVAQVKRAMIQQSRRLIMVADHSKLGEVALCKVAPLQAVSVFVTDDQADQEMLNAIWNAGVEVVIAS